MEKAVGNKDQRKYVENDEAHLFTECMWEKCRDAGRGNIEVR